MSRPLRILMPSIVDGDVRRGGAWTVTRGLLALLGRLHGGAEVMSVVPPEPLWHRGRQAACVLAAPLSGVPAKVRFLRSRAFRRQIRRVAAQERFDLLVVNGSDLLWSLDVVPETKTIAIVHNREASLYHDQVTALTPRVPLLQRALFADGTRLQRFEHAGLRRVQGAIFLSAADADDLSTRVPDLDHLVLPPVFIDPPARIPKASRAAGLDLGYLANFTWWPNRDGFQWLIREVLPNVPDRVRLHLFGRGSREVAAGHPRVVAHGFVDDLRDVWRTCDRMVVPTRFGSGVSVKTAESLYNGMPLLSTRFGLRGLPAIEDPQIVVHDSERNWIAFLASPVSREPSRERLPLRVSDPFAIDTHRDRFERFVCGLLSRRTP